MGDTLKWGIMGAARVNERLLPAIVKGKNSELVAIASRREGAAKAILDKYAPDHEGVTCYDELDVLINDNNVEAIYCPMANEEHAEWALKVIKAGKHILIEKPMTTDLAAIDAIEAAAKENNVKVMEGFMYRFHPQHHKVQEMIDGGLIGDVVSARSSFSFLMPESRHYRINRNIANGGGALWDIGPYAIHTLRWCFAKDNVPAEPIKVIAHAKLNEHGADMVTSGVMDFGPDENGNARFGHFDMSFERGRKAEYEVIGQKGWIKVHNTWAYGNVTPVISWEAGKEGATEELPLADHFILEIEHFSDCVLNDKAPFLTFDDARGNCRAIEAVIDAINAS